jgi:hypothetical protein
MPAYDLTFIQVESSSTLFFQYFNFNYNAKEKNFKKRKQKGIVLFFFLLNKQINKPVLFERITISLKLFYKQNFFWQRIFS